MRDDWWRMTDVLNGSLGRSHNIKQLHDEWRFTLAAAAAAAAASYVTAD